MKCKSFSVLCLFKNNIRICIGLKTRILPEHNLLISNKKVTEPGGVFSSVLRCTLSTLEEESREEMFCLKVSLTCRITLTSFLFCHVRENALLTLYFGLQESFLSCDSMSCRSGGYGYMTQFTFHLVINFHYKEIVPFTCKTTAQVSSLKA